MALLSLPIESNHESVDFGESLAHNEKGSPAMESLGVGAVGFEPTIAVRLRI